MFVCARACVCVCLSAMGLCYVAQLAERRSLAGELTLSCARPSEDGWPLCG